MRALFLFTYLFCFCVQVSLAQDSIVDDIRTHNQEAVRLNTIGFGLLEKGKAEESKPYFMKAIELDSAEIGYYLNMGNACHQTKDWALALKTFSRAIVVLPAEPDLYYYRGEVYNKQVNYQQAIVDFTAAIQLGGGSDPMPLLYLYYFNRGVAYLKLQRYSDAINDFTETLKINEAHYGALANRGMAKFNTKDKAGACQDWNSAYALGYEGIKPQLINHCR